jgi:hypothetical protein
LLEPCQSLAEPCQVFPTWCKPLLSISQAIAAPLPMTFVPCIEPCQGLVAPWWALLEPCWSLAEPCQALPSLAKPCQAFPTWCEPLLSISQVIAGMHITLVHLPVLVQCLMVQQVHNFFVVGPV